MAWTPLRLGVKTDGAEYGETTVRVADLLKKMSSGVSEGSTPAVVWIYSPEDEKENASASGTLFQSEGVGIALKKFRTLRVDVTRIASERIRRQYKTTPAFHFYDPSGDLIGKIEGKSATSLSKFSTVMERAWNKSFAVKLRDYSKKMTKILDRLDRYTGKKQVLDQSLARLAQKPNPRKQRQLDEDAQELEKMAQKIAEDEQEVIASVILRSSYLPKGEGKKVAKK